MNINDFLFAFSYKRKVPEAIAFHVSHFIISMLIGGIISLALGPLGILMVGALAMAVIYSIAITVLTVHQKQLPSSYYMLAFLSGILAIYLGTLGGLIPATILLTLTSSGKDNTF